MSFTQYLRFFDDAARGIYEYTEVINGEMVHPGIVSKYKIVRVFLSSELNMPCCRNRKRNERIIVNKFNIHKTKFESYKINKWINE